MICRCIRWHAAKEIEDTKTPQLLDAITEIWLQHHGAPKEFLMDGERGIAVSQEAKEFFDNHSIKLTVRATGKHCHFIEKRGDLLKTQLRKLDTSCKQEGISIPFPRLLAEAVFAGNALISINQTTPYNALYGRVPNILPDINHVPQPPTRDAPEQIRHANRLREISISRMIETTAAERISRAMNTRTLASAQEMFDLDDQVDFYRKPDAKDLPGWSGPARITDMSEADRGIIIVDYRGRKLVCDPQNLRQHLAFLCFFFSMAPLDHPCTQAVQHLYIQIANLPSRNNYTSRLFPKRQCMATYKGHSKIHITVERNKTTTATLTY